MGDALIIEKSAVGLDGKVETGRCRIGCCCFTGLRSGEKLYEELITAGEGVDNTSHKRIMVLKSKDAWNGHGSAEDFRKWLTAGVDELYELAKQHDAPGIRAKLKELVPEYVPQESESVF